MINIKLGNGDIAIVQTVNSDNNEISLTFTQLDDTGRVGELHREDEIGEPICKIHFDNIDGLDNFVDILDSLRKRVYWNHHFFDKALL